MAPKSNKVILWRYKQSQLPYTIAHYIKVIRWVFKFFKFFNIGTGLRRRLPCDVLRLTLHPCQRRNVEEVAVVVGHRVYTKRHLCYVKTPGFTRGLCDGTSLGLRNLLCMTLQPTRCHLIVSTCIVTTLQHLHCNNTNNAKLFYPQSVCDLALGICDVSLRSIYKFHNMLFHVENGAHSTAQLIINMCDVV